MHFMSMQNEVLYTLIKLRNKPISGTTNFNMCKRRPKKTHNEDAQVFTEKFAFRRPRFFHEDARDALCSSVS